jgi:C-terminal processing protease CtpA/Prc
LLGIEVAPDSDAVIVKHVVINSPADKERSKLNIGDKIISVNDTKLNSSTNFNSLLINTKNEKVLLEVEDKSGNKREVIIRPTSNLKNQLDDEWAKEKRALVDKYSNGRLGYLHIRTMGWTNYEKFERDLTAAGYGKEGLVIDVRNNNGGWITDFLMTSLNVDQHAYTIPRGAANNIQKEHKNFVNHYPFGERLPYGVWTKPSIALCNENSYSNAEIFSHAYKTLGIGKLVGQPTFGAVISTGGRYMIDGTWVRLPSRGWFVKKTLESMEGGPAVPDILIDNAPDYRRNGEDTQLKTAVEELLKEINSK